MNAICAKCLMLSLLASPLPASIGIAVAQESDFDVIWQAQAGAALAFSSDSSLLVTGNTLRDANDGAQMATYFVHPIGGGVDAAAISPDATYVALGVQTYNQNLNVYDALTGAIVRSRISAHNNGTTTVAFSPDGTTLASGGRDGTAKLWSLPDVSLVRTLGGTTGYNPRVFAIAFAPDGQSLAVGGQGGVNIFGVADGALLRTFTTVSTLSLAYSPDGQMLASGSDVIDQQGQCTDCTIKLWNSADGTLLRTIDGNNDGVIALAFSPDGTVLAVGSGDRIFDGIVRFFRVADGTLIDSFEQTGAYVTDVAYSPDGNLFALSRSDAQVIVARNPGSADGCDYVLTPATRSFATRGGRGKVEVTTASGCAWTATSDAAWVHVLSGTATSAGTIDYAVDANPGAARSATIDAGGQTHTIHQQGSAVSGHIR